MKPIRVIKHTNTMKPGETYTLKVVRLDDIQNWLKERPLCNVRNDFRKRLEGDI